MAKIAPGLWSPESYQLSHMQQIVGNGPSTLTLVLTLTLATPLTMAKLRAVYKIISSISKADFGMFNMVVAICLLISGPESKHNFFSSSFLFLVDLLRKQSNTNSLFVY